MRISKCCRFVPLEWKTKEPGGTYLYMIQCGNCLRQTSPSYSRIVIVREWNSFFVKPKKKGQFLIVAKRTVKERIKEINQMRKHFGI